MPIERGCEYILARSMEAVTLRYCDQEDCLEKGETLMIHNRKELDSQKRKIIQLTTLNCT